MRRALGRTGLVVNAIGLGCMPMSLAGRPPYRQSIETIHAALDAGVDFFDTADVYCLDHREMGANERLLADALASWGGDRSSLVIATKGGLLRPDGAWASDARPERLVEACEASLRALGVAAIDLYQLHAPDDAVPLEDSVGALARLQEQGKIKHIGLSNVSVDEIERASTCAVIATVQNQCSVIEPTGFVDGVMAYCDQNEITYLAYAPLGGWGNTAVVAEDGVIGAVAARHGVSPYRVALAWLLAKSAAVIPIPGASRPASIRDSAGAAALALSPSEVAELDALAS